MSAAEKLRALDMGGTEDDAELCTMGKVDVLALRDALPQIAAVVEAAERAADVATTDAQRMGPILRREVAPALAALDEALSPKMIYTDASGEPFDPQPIREALS